MAPGNGPYWFSSGSALQKIGQGPQTNTNNCYVLLEIVADQLRKLNTATCSGSEHGTKAPGSCWEPHQDRPRHGTGVEIIKLGSTSMPDRLTALSITWRSVTYLHVVCRCVEMNTIVSTGLRLSIYTCPDSIMLI